MENKMLKAFTTKELLQKVQEYADLRGWDIYYFRLWKLIEFIYWLQTSKLLPETTRTNRKLSRMEIKTMIDYLSKLENGRPI